MADNGLILELLLGSALRSMILGGLVFALLKLTRWRDLRLETAVWIAVLLAAFLMPLLSIGLPLNLTVTLPRLAAPIVHAGSQAGAPAITATIEPTSLDSAVAHAQSLLWGLYCMVTLVSLARLATGLILTFELYRAAEPVVEPWARGRNIRTSRAIASPVSLANRILLPADHRDWSEAKRLAVLAHEESHIRRGDFFIQLLASVHRAVFWFSPFAWWLQLRLGELAETASDKAAIQCLGDPTVYAEILVDVACKGRGLRPTVAMARGPGVAKRVEQILAGIPEQSLGAVSRIAALTAVVAVSLTLAQIHAALASTPDNAPPVPILSAVAEQIPHAAPSERPAIRSIRASSAHPHAKPAAKTMQAPPVPETDVTYNPRALLDDPEAVVLPAFARTGAQTGNTFEDTGAVLDAVTESKN